MQNNDKRQAIFLELVDSDGPLTPTEVGNAVNETRQAVKYHLDQLVEQGLVIRDDGAYRPQPLFTDPDIEGRFVEAMSDLLPDVYERVEVDARLSGEEQTAMVFNCVRMFVAMELLDGAGAENE